MTSPTPDPVTDQQPVVLSDTCVRCHHAWHGLRCHCGCLTSFEAKQP